MFVAQHNKAARFEPAEHENGQALATHTIRLKV